MPKLSPAQQERHNRALERFKQSRIEVQPPIITTEKTEHQKTAKRAENWFRDAVYSTHWKLPTGEFQIDPRDNKYLNSHARQMRAIIAAMKRGEE
ncbi:MAG: hypothetical protein GY749_22850 [Desulfobacteraceae bacterium]|nr:hypothetical protein [Desulfobacteraceae bacterium]